MIEEIEPNEQYPNTNTDLANRKLPAPSELVSLAETSNADLKDIVLPDIAKAVVVDPKKMDVLQEYHAKKHHNDGRATLRFEACKHALVNAANDHNEGVPEAEAHALKYSGAVRAAIALEQDCQTELAQIEAEIRPKIESLESKFEQNRQHSKLPKCAPNREGFHRAILCKMNFVESPLVDLPTEPIEVDVAEPRGSSLALKLFTWVLTVILGMITGLALGVLTGFLDRKSFEFSKYGVGIPFIVFLLVGPLLSMSASIIFRSEMSKLYKARLDGIKPDYWASVLPLLPILGLLVVDYSGFDFYANKLLAKKAEDLGLPFTSTPWYICLLTSAFCLSLYLGLQKLVAEANTRAEHSFLAAMQAQKSRRQEFERRKAEYDQAASGLSVARQKAIQAELDNRDDYQQLDNIVSDLEPFRAKVEEFQVKLAAARTQLETTKKEPMIAPAFLQKLTTSAEAVTTARDNLYEVVYVGHQSEIDNRRRLYTN